MVTTHEWEVPGPFSTKKPGHTVSCPRLNGMQISLPAHQVIVIGGLSTRTSLSLSIVNIWARKNGSFTSKLCPSLTEGFDYTAQLTLAAVASLAMENPQLFQSQEINQGSMFPRTSSISAAKERPRWAGQDSFFSPEIFNIPSRSLQFRESFITLSISYRRNSNATSPFPNDILLTLPSPQIS